MKVTLFNDDSSRLVGTEGHHVLVQVDEIELEQLRRSSLSGLIKDVYTAVSNIESFRNSSPSSSSSIKKKRSFKSFLPPRSSHKSGFMSNVLRRMKSKKNNGPKETLKREYAYVKCETLDSLISSVDALIDWVIQTDEHEKESNSAEVQVVDENHKSSIVGETLMQATFETSTPVLAKQDRIEPIDIGKLRQEFFASLLTPPVEASAVEKVQQSSSVAEIEQKCAVCGDHVSSIVSISTSTDTQEEIIEITENARENQPQLQEALNIEDAVAASKTVFQEPLSSDQIGSTTSHWVAFDDDCMKFESATPIELEEPQKEVQEVKVESEGAKNSVEWLKLEDGLKMELEAVVENEDEKLKTESEGAQEDSIKSEILSIEWHTMEDMHQWHTMKDMDRVITLVLDEKSDEYMNKEHLNEEAKNADSPISINCVCSCHKKKAKQPQDEDANSLALCSVADVSSSPYQNRGFPFSMCSVSSYHLSPQGNHVNCNSEIGEFPSYRLSPQGNQGNANSNSELAEYQAPFTPTDQRDIDSSSVLVSDYAEEFDSLNYTETKKAKMVHVCDTGDESDDDSAASSDNDEDLNGVEIEIEIDECDVGNMARKIKNGDRCDNASSSVHDKSYLEIILETIGWNSPSL